MSGVDARDLSRRAVGGFLWSAASFGASKLVVFAMTVLLARLLAPRDFGLVAAGLSVAAFLEIALDFGVGSALIYEQERGITERVRIAFTLSLLIAVAMTGVGVAISPLVAGYFRVPQATAMFQVLFCYLLFRGVGLVQDAVLQRDLRYRERTVVDVLRALARGAASVALAFGGQGAWAIVVGTVVGEAVAAAAYCWLVRVMPTWRLRAGVVRALLKFGLPLLTLNIVNTASTEGDKMIVGGRLDSTALGQYTIAQKLPEMLILNVYWVFQKIAYGIYARARTGGPAMFRAAMLKALRLVTFFGFPMGAGLAIVSPAVVPLLFSPRWAPAVPTMVIISVTAGLSAIGYASGDIFPAIGRPAALLRATAATVVGELVVMWIVAPYGIEAIALVHLAFMVFWGPVRLHVANRLVGTGWRECLVAMRPGALGAAGVTALGLPAALLTGTGWAGLAATVAAGSIGGAGVVLLFDRAAVAEVIALVRTRGDGE
ncbi:MAG TPA: lipopolysaccharide biosynthesis protein [Streptosporangiaceae bacterium]